jgi:hypothetical protein
MNVEGGEAWAHHGPELPAQSRRESTASPERVEPGQDNRPAAAKTRSPLAIAFFRNRRSTAFNRPVP